jgi:hypothetical protein
LNVFHHLLGVTAFAIDPYQIGHENEEGIASGAFWFYRKLGFRPTQASLKQLTEREERKLAGRASYRTSARMLQSLAAGSMIFELDDSRRGDWDRFQVRNIGLRVQRVMARRYAGDPEKMRRHSLETVSQALSQSLKEWSDDELGALTDMSVAVALIPDLEMWERRDKDSLAQILSAKVTGDETRYLKLMQRHQHFREAMIKLGN